LVRTDRYSWGAIWLHWSIAVLVLVNLTLGLFSVPPLPISGETAKLGHDAHGLLGYVMLALVVLHIAAALRHHLLLRDAVLGRMAPGLIRNG
jgi:cytochrome b561